MSVDSAPSAITLPPLTYECVNVSVEVGTVNEVPLVTVALYKPPAFFVPVNPTNVKFLILNLLKN